MADEFLWAVNTFIVDPYILQVDNSNNSEIPHTLEEHHSQTTTCKWSSTYSLSRQYLVMWTFLYIGTLMLYFLMSSLTYWKYYNDVKELQIKANKKKNVDAASQAASLKKTHYNTTHATDFTINQAHWHNDYPQLSKEILTSVWSLIIITSMVAPLELYTMCSHGKLYYNISDHSTTYFLLSPFLFLFFTDSTIYFIHRGLHHRYFYFLHKLHHQFKETTPFSAFSFHPVDGWLQGLPYHLFILLFPMHARMHGVALLIVGLWTINIHDRVTFDLWAVNGAAHHTVHHTKFYYNYGQYFTFWDRLMGTYKDPKTEWPYDKDDVNGDGVAQSLFEQSLMAKDILKKLI